MKEFDIAEDIVRHLDAGTRDLDPAVTARLRVARETALAKVPVQAHAVSWAAAGKHTLAHGGWDHSQRMLRLTLGVMVVALSLLGWQYWQQQQEAEDEAGLLDAKLLSSEMPPHAFANQDFSAWLQEAR